MAFLARPFGVALLIHSTLLGALAHAEPSRALPLTRVRLYEAGVAYFERTGVPTGSTVLPVPESHLDDALKTLTVLSEGGDVRVSGVELDLRVTRARRMALAGLDAEGEAPSFVQQLESLEGENVEVHAGRERITGTLLDAIPSEQSPLERCLPAPGGAPAEGGCTVRKVEAMTLLTSEGTLRRFALPEIRGVRATDPKVVERLRAAFIPSSRAATPQALHLESTRGKPITLGYIAEAPLWRASYRLVLDDDAAALQGWALIHNDTEEDWRGVTLELVNGQPDSFLFPLAAPRYAERRLITPEQHLSSAPQLSRQTPDAMWDDGEPATGFGYGVGFGSVGAGGGGAGRVGAEASGVAESSLLRVGDLAGGEPTSGEALGALFRYGLARPIDLAAQKSLLVPFLSETVSVERVTVFDDGAAAGRASILFDNTSDQTLPPGTIALFEGGGFAGESATERVEPGQRRVLPFGVDLDVHLKAEPGPSTRQLRLLSYEDGRVVQHFLRHRQFGYAIENRGASPRSVHVVLDTVNNAKVKGSDEVYVDAATDRVHAVFQLPAGQQKRYAVQLDEGLGESVRVADLHTGQLRGWLAEGSLPREQVGVLEQALRSLVKHERTLKRRRALKGEVAALDGRLQRLQRALSVVRAGRGDEAELLARRIVDTEERRARLTREFAALDPYPALVRTKQALAKLNAAVPG